MNIKSFFVTFTALVVFVATTYAQNDGDQDKYVSKQQHEQLQRQFDTLKAEFESFRQSRAATATPSQQDHERALKQLQVDMEEIRMLAEQNTAGSSKFLVTGFGTAGFTDTDGGDSTFSASLNPVFLWKIGDRLLFESELELSLSSGGGSGGHGGMAEESEAETEVELGYAHASYLLNDYITVGGGKFLTPFGIFNERVHPTWINKLPDAPLPFSHHGGIVPMASLGGYVRGGVPLGSTKANYVFYLSNGPALNVEGEEAGTLDFENFDDINNNKAVGGRVGFLPIPQLEFGYSFQFSRVDPSGFEDVQALLQALDMSYTKYLDCIGGILDVRTEWVWSDVDDVAFEGGGHDDGDMDHDEMMEMVMFDNKRWGGYVQVAYRPTASSNDIIKNIEGVVRWDILDLPDDAPESHDQQRWTLGLNYWISPSTVFKAAYRFDDRDGEDNIDALLLQFATGF